MTLYTNSGIQPEPPAPNPQDVLAAQGGRYRYGFQGQERMDEVKGSGNSWDYKYRMHDARLGRFFAVDPLSAGYPHNSTYAFSENNVIAFVELEGLEKIGVFEVQPNGHELKLRVFNWSDESADAKKAWMSGWNVKEDFFSGNPNEFWTANSLQSSQGSIGTTWKKYAFEESYKKMGGKAFAADWTGVAWEKFVAFDNGLKKPENGIPFALTVAATILTAGSWAVAAEGAGGLTAAIAASPGSFALEAAGLILDINSLSKDPAGVSFMEDFFGAENMDLTLDWASVGISSIDQVSGTVELGVSVKGGNKYQIMFDAVNQVFQHTSTFLDMTEASKNTKEAMEQKK